MTVTVLWIVGIVSSMLIILFTSFTTNATERLVSKFEIHPKLSAENVTVSIGSQRLEGNDKLQMVHDFNEALYLKMHYILPGTEELYLHPEDSETPIIMDTKIGKKAIRLFVYCYKDRVEVVKQYKKKLVAYCLRSDKLQKRSNLAAEDIALKGS